MLIGFLGICQTAYFAKYQKIADSLEAKYQIPSSVMLAVAYHESGGGVSRNAKLLNNHFGIVGKNNLLKTHGIKSKYRYFPSDTAGYVGFCDLVARKSFYANLKGNPDPAKWVYALHRAGYCPSSTWPGKVIGIIRKNKVN